jgi:diguanylate cyclase (GGDEF)-like protein
MSSDGKKGQTGETVAPALLVKALDQNEQVQDKVEQCAVDLSSVNTVLKEGITEGAPPLEVERALDKNEEVEVKVQECADALATVNDALTDGIDEYKDLKHKLSESNAALSKSKVQEERSRHIALHDAVTGLPNLTLFNDRFRLALAQAKRHVWRLAVMFIDLDEFKSINDTYGHDVGDRVLQMVAKRLLAVVRGGDTVSRRGGDEFLFLMLEAKDETNVAKLAAKIIENIGEACEVEGLKLTVRPSIGIAIYPEDGQSPQELLKNADTAMYAAKQQKRGTSFYSQVAVP